MDKNRFNKARRKHNPGGHFFDYDLASYSDLKESLAVAGIVKFPNVDQIYKVMQETREKRNRSARLVFFGVDTNIAYLRFFSRNLPYNFKGTMLQARDFRYVVSDVVRREIDTSIRDKYNGIQIRKMRENFAQSGLLSGFFNASGKVTRRAKDADAEINLLRRDFGALKASSTEYSEHKEERDILIAQSYRIFQMDENVDVVLFTADQDMVNHAMSADLEPVFVKFPPDIYDLCCPVNGTKMCNLLYTIAIRFGAVSLRKPDIAILGEWIGKGPEDYYNERVWVQIDDPELRKSTARHVRISRKCIENLGERYTGGVP